MFFFRAFLVAVSVNDKSNSWKTQSLLPVKSMLLCAHVAAFNSISRTRKSKLRRGDREDASNHTVRMRLPVGRPRPPLRTSVAGEAGAHRRIARWKSAFPGIRKQKGERFDLHLEVIENCVSLLPCVARERRRRRRRAYRCLEFRFITRNRGSDGRKKK